VIVMSSRRLFALLLAATAFAACVAPSSAVAFESPNDPSSGELVEAPAEWDARTVSFEGEAIGEAMHRPDGTWLHLNDDAYMYRNIEEGEPLGGYNTGMPVWIERDLAEKVTVFGDYTHEGDVVVVRGVFNAACAQHGGDMDIHATTLTVKVPGHVVREPVKPVKAAVAALMFLLAVGLGLVSRRTNTRESRGLLDARSRR